MIIYTQANLIRQRLNKAVDDGKTIGFVPTMGALHEGHLQLIHRAASENDLTVSSIFVNPTQFNDSKDFEKYPVTVERDIESLYHAGNSLLYLPSVSDVYPDGLQGLKRYELGYLEMILEGSFRPGHFQGVCQVVDRLLQTVKPDRLYMGRKDYQQCMVVKKLIELTGATTALITCETIREKDGLAMSSRNTRLDPQQRVIATEIYRTLCRVRETIRPGLLTEIKNEAVTNLSVHGFKVDYVEICDASTLQPTAEWDGISLQVALIAAFLGEVRLIDNLQL